MLSYELPENDDLHLVFLTSGTCAPCGKAKDLLEIVPSEVNVVSVESPEGQEIAAQHGITSVPALILTQPLKEPKISLGFPGTINALLEEFDSLTAMHRGGF